MQMLNGARVASAISCLAELGIPDLVHDGPRSAEELAVQIGADAQALYRLMRATASVGVLSEGPDAKFSETPASAVLRRDGNPSLRDVAIMGGREWRARAWAKLTDCVRTGKPVLEQFYGASSSEYLNQHPEEARIFDATMTELSAIDSLAVADAYSFEGIRSIVDVGGGHGRLLATILGGNPTLTGTLFELAHVIDRARNGPLEPLLDRCTLVSGDMFSSVPKGADAYIMKHIIHNWPDDACVKVLRLCRGSVNAEGRLVVVDKLIQPGNDYSPSKFLDLQMLIFHGGCERTEQQFRELFAASGWRFTRLIRTAGPDWIMEGVPA